MKLHHLLSAITVITVFQDDDSFVAMIGVWLCYGIYRVVRYGVSPP